MAEMHFVVPGAVLPTPFRWTGRDSEELVRSPKLSLESCRSTKIQALQQVANGKTAPVEAQERLATDKAQNR